MKSGYLAKLPREIIDRFEEFRNTTVLSFDDIYDLEEKVEKIVIPAPKKLSIFKVKNVPPPITPSPGTRSRRSSVLTWSLPRNLGSGIGRNIE